MFTMVMSRFIMNTARHITTRTHHLLPRGLGATATWVIGVPFHCRLNSGRTTGKPASLIPLWNIILGRGMCVHESATLVGIP